MKFKDLPCGEIFTYWVNEKHRTAIKIVERGTYERERAVCLDSGEIVDVHHNKDIKSLEKIPEDLELKFGRDGQAFLCSPMTEGKTFAHRILLIGGEIMNDEWLKAQKPHTLGGIQNNLDQVDIILQILGRKIEEMQTAYKMVKMELDQILSETRSDNRIMSTTRIKKLALPTE